MTKNSNMRTIEGTNIEYLDVTLGLETDLTDEELKALATEAAQASEEKATLEAEKTEYDKSMKKQIDGKDGIIVDRLSRHRRGKSPKDVPCRHLFDYDAGTVTTIRLDVLEGADNFIVKTREMRPDERQSHIPGSEPEVPAEGLDDLFPDPETEEETDPPHPNDTLGGLEEAADYDAEDGFDLGDDGIDDEED